jgi:Domain of unknown function (DUF4216)
MRVRLYEIYDSFIFCKWIKNQCGVKKDKEGFISVDFNRLGYQYDPFILANREAKQVFYITDPANKKMACCPSGQKTHCRCWRYR